jgi:hypothetical protein
MIFGVYFFNFQLNFEGFTTSAWMLGQVQIPHSN